MSNYKADLLLKSNNIFTAATPYLINGFVAIKKNKIIAVDTKNNIDKYIDSRTEIIELGDKVVCPGFVDVHCFFTGYALNFVGIDLCNTYNPNDIIKQIKNYANLLENKYPLLAHGLDIKTAKSLTMEIVDKIFPERPVILFTKGNETCVMNSAAIKKYKFTPDTCYPESYWRLLPEILGNKNFILKEFKKYMSMLNKRGITSIKEMAFDDFYGFTDVLEELEMNRELTLRISFMSQPVGSNINLDFGHKMRERFKGNFIKFSGYNRMTDGSISQLCGHLKEPYNCNKNICCAQNIDYELIEKETLAADAKGFRFSLHAQGDAAISKVLDIFEKCQQKNGKLINRHSITDIEFSDPKDLERMGKMGVIAEIYPQIMSIANRHDKISMIAEKIGLNRGKYYWNRRKMADSGVIISCGTDLPLTIPNIPESIYHSCGALFPEGGEPFNKENTLTISELLTAWTKGGHYNLYYEDILGTLEPGKLADIAVLDGNVFNTPMEKIRDIKVCLTLVEGKIVYNGL